MLLPGISPASTRSSCPRRLVGARHGASLSKLRIGRSGTTCVALRAGSGRGHFSTSLKSHCPLRYGSRSRIAAGKLVSNSKCSFTVYSLPATTDTPSVAGCDQEVCRVPGRSLTVRSWLPGTNSIVRGYAVMCPVFSLTGQPVDLPSTEITNAFAGR